MGAAPALLGLWLWAGCGPDPKETPQPAPAAEAKEDTASRDGKLPVAILKTTQGDIYIRFYPDKAPEHVKNFLAHSGMGTYSGTYFHRVKPGFMIQGGDPNTCDADRSNDGMGGHAYMGPGTKLRAEFNDIRHVRGVLSAARETHPDTAGSQFFIMVGAATHLDNQYTAFGRVFRGMDAVDLIVRQPGQPLGGGCVNPYTPQYIQSVAVEYWSEEEIAKKRE
jgi:peptidyl-prolyl cis-trans isomerase B (cyclophilin B)